MSPRTMHSAKLGVEQRVPLENAAAEHGRAQALADPARFREFFQTHFAWVWRTLRRLGVAERSLADASQRVFWTAARRLEAISAVDERAFLFGTARRVAADFRRLRDQAPVAADVDSELDLSDLSVPNPEELLEQKRSRLILDQILDSMAVELREVLILQEGEGMTLSEIATTLAIPHGTAASRLRRAREQFRGLLKRWLSQSRSKGSP